MLHKDILILSHSSSFFSSANFITFFEKPQQLHVLDKIYFVITN